MNDSPKFTDGWKTAIVVALVASFVSCDRSKHQKAPAKPPTTNAQYEKRIDDLEKSVKKMETYLYNNVSPHEQRLKDLEKSLKEMKEHPPALEISK